VSKEEYDAVVAERDALKQQLEELTGKQIDTEIKPENNDNSSIQFSAKDFDVNSVLSQISVEEYSYDTDFWHYAFLVLKNNSEFNLRITANVDFFDENGLIIGTDDTTIEAFEAGTETIMYFMPDEKFTKMEYEIDVKEEDWYECVVSDLSYEVSKAKDKIILSVTNNGEEAARFVKGYVLFLKDGVIVGFDQNYFTDDDSEIKPGKTIKEEMHCYEDFDSVKVYLAGYRSGFGF